MVGAWLDQNHGLQGLGSLISDLQETFPWSSAPPEHLNDGRATHESFVKLMDETLWSLTMGFQWISIAFQWFLSHSEPFGLPKVDRAAPQAVHRTSFGHATLHVSYSN